ncbi:MAG TPA: MgtC/SapB family protein [Blastocatellia bacterium]|nr:MgtC/SapB family protein [Blastocatellia bacterium]
MEWNHQLQIMAEVGLAIVLGGLIGLERELADKPAGLRTHMLVAGAAALLTGVGYSLVAEFHPDPSNTSIRSDPLRLIEAIITGISFLGAGTIIRRQESEHIEGLTTAASLLFSGMLGICVALRLFPLAISVTLLTLIILRGVRVIEKRLALRRREKQRKSDAQSG